MMRQRAAVILFSVSFLSMAVVWACAFDTTLRAYLDGHFWLPFSKDASHFERKNVKRAWAPFAGMSKERASAPLAKARQTYQQVCELAGGPRDSPEVRRGLATARADQTLSERDREEIELIDAKLDLRCAQPGQPQKIRDLQKKLENFLATAHDPVLLSEARGWLAHAHYRLGERTAAGKIYLDELNRDGSNLSRETILLSLRMTYRNRGGRELLDHLEEYFDKPEHAAFAIQYLTNPNWNRYADGTDPSPEDTPPAYQRIRALLDQHADLLKSERGEKALAMLGMRTALRMGDPPGALKIAAMIPPGAPIRTEPDFEWMLASAHFLSRQYAAAERPLLTLFQSARSAPRQKAAAAYGLCGVYRKMKNPVEQLRFALWLAHNQSRSASDTGDFDVYWAPSGWDASVLLDAETSIGDLTAFLDRYPNDPEARLVKYSLAVKLTRENRYEEAAQLYQSINAVVRAPRIRQLADLNAQANRKDLPAQDLAETRFRLAKFIVDNPERIYFNDALWSGLQRYALTAQEESGFTAQERAAAIVQERKLKDDQEEYWRAYVILREVVQEAGPTELGRKSARLALRCLRNINRERFGRADEIRNADIELSKWLRG